jgi:hypothetical protein
MKLLTTIKSDNIYSFSSDNAKLGGYDPKKYLRLTQELKRLAPPYIAPFCG